MLQTPVTNSYANGGVTWSGSYDTSTTTWTVTSTGTVPAHTGGATAVSRRLTATVHVHSGAGTFNAATWNYAISAGTSNANTCDLDLTNSMQFHSPLYVEGNLCLFDSASVLRNTDPLNLTSGASCHSRTAPAASAPT